MTRPLEAQLHYMKIFARRAENDWERVFARSILWQAKKPVWLPSPEQRAVMDRMVDDWFADSDGENDVIEVDQQ